MTVTKQHPTIKLPAGDVYVHTYKRTKYTDVQVDFIMLAEQDRMPSAELVDRLGDLASDRCFAAGRRDMILRTSGPVLWSMTVLNTDVPRVLEVLVPAAHGNDEPLRALIAEWEKLASAA